MGMRIESYLLISSSQPSENKAVAILP